jgi:hypothetical protein
MTRKKFNHPIIISLCDRLRRRGGRDTPRRGDPAQVLLWPGATPPAYDYARLARRDPVLAAALFANDLRNPPEQRFVAHAEVARYFYGDPPRYGEEAFARLRDTLRRKMGPKWPRYEALMNTLAARLREDRS